MEGDEGGGVTVMSPARGRGGAPGAVASRAGRRCLLAVLAAVAAFPALAQAQSGSDRAAIIARTKQSVVAIGTYDRLRKPPFLFSGTGFAIEDGSVVATNAAVPGERQRRTSRGADRGVGLGRRGAQRSVPGGEGGEGRAATATWRCCICRVKTATARAGGGEPAPCRGTGAAVHRLSHRHRALAPSFPPRTAPWWPR